MDVFEIATDDFIKDMCKNIRRSGGTLPNPNAEEPGAPAVIPCNGVAISPTAEERLVLLAYYVCHLKRTSLIRFYLLTSVFVEYDERVEVGGKAS
jgi:hypothetical protein